MKKTRVFAVALLIILIVTCLFACDSNEREGVAVLSLATDKGYPVEMQFCFIAMNIVDFPASYNNDSTDYFSTVTLNYRFHNPTANAVEMPLHLPYGAIPTYDEYHRLNACDTVMTVDGETIQGVVHCWYGSNNYDNQNDYIVPNYRLSDDYYNANLDVYKYVYQISVPIGFQEIVAEYKLGAGDIIVSAQSLHNSYKFAGKTIVQVRIQDDREFVVYSFGKRVPIFEQSVTINEIWGGEISNSSLQLVSEIKMSFDEMACEYYDENGELNRTDWYNAVLKKMQNSGVDICQSATQFDVTDEVRKWYDYTITIPANGTVNHVVTMPLFPTIRWAYEPTVYRYDVSLDNLCTWQSVGEIKIVANTEYNAVKKTKKEVNQQGVRKSNVTMQFSTESNPYDDVARRTTLKILLMLLPEFLGAVIAIVVVTVSKSKKKRSLEKNNLDEK